MKIKPFYLSKTNWVGILTTAVAILAYTGSQDWLTPAAVNGFLFVSGVLAIILRQLTEVPTTMSPKHMRRDYN